MKNKVLSFAIALIALFAFNTAQAQNAHFTDVMVSEDGLTITGKIAGLGNKFTGQEISITYSADVAISLECYAASGNGQLTGAGNSVKPETAKKNIVITAKNGHVTFSLTLEKASEMKAKCPGRLIEGETNGVEVLNGTLSFSVGNASGTMTL